MKDIVLPKVQKENGFTAIRIFCALIVVYEHFIVLTEINGNKLRVNDPNSIRRSETDWDFDRVLEQVKAAWSYSAG